MFRRFRGDSLTHPLDDTKMLRASRERPRNQNKKREDLCRIGIIISWLAEEEQYRNFCSADSFIRSKRNRHKSQLFLHARLSVFLSVQPTHATKRTGDDTVLVLNRT